MTFLSLAFQLVNTVEAMVYQSQREIVQEDGTVPEGLTVTIQHPMSTPLLPLQSMFYVQLT